MLKNKLLFLLLFDGTLYIELFLGAIFTILIIYEGYADWKEEKREKKGDSRIERFVVNNKGVLVHELDINTIQQCIRRSLENGHNENYIKDCLTQCNNLYGSIKYKVTEGSVKKFV